MDDSTKKVLIVTIGLVSLAVIVAITFVILRPAPLFKELRCSNGTVVRVINDPSQLLIKYTGVAAVFSVEVEKKLKQSFQIGDVLLQTATDSVQILDQRLKEVITIYSLKDPCATESETIIKKIEAALQKKENLNKIGRNISEQAIDGQNNRSDADSITKNLEQFREIAIKATRDLTIP